MQDETYADLRELLELGADSKVLLFSTEGDTDPESYRDIVGDGVTDRDGFSPSSVHRAGRRIEPVPTHHPFIMRDDGLNPSPSTVRDDGLNPSPPIVPSAVRDDGLSLSV